MMELHRTRESEINTTLEVMAGRQIASLVVEKLGADTILGSSGGDANAGVLTRVKSSLKNVVNRDTIDANEQALMRLGSRINISAPSESNVVAIEYRAKSPELAKRIVDAWIASFTSEHIRLNRNEGSFDFFERQESQLLEQLSEVEAEIRDNKTAFGIITIEGQQDSLEQQLLEVRRDQAATKLRWSLPRRE